MEAETELIGITEIAEIAGVSRQAVWKWTDSKSAHFPEPVLRLAMGPLYERSSVNAWLKTRAAAGPGNPQ